MTEPLQRVAVVLNENARSVNARVIATLQERIGTEDLFISRHLDEAPQIAQTIVARGYDTVLTGGGDGTFSVTATEVGRAARTAGVLPPRFGLLKLGTGNALAWVVGASSLSDPAAAWSGAALPPDGATQPVHLVDVEGEQAPFAGLGADAQILGDYHATKEQLDGTPFSALGTGLTGYTLAALSRSLPAILFREMPTIRVVNEGDDVFAISPQGVDNGSPVRAGETIYEGKARMAAFSTIPYYGFGMRLFPFAQPGSGRIHLRVSRLGSPQFLGNVRGIWNGSYYNPRYFSDYLVQDFRIESEQPIEFQIGGDSRGARTLVRASVMRQPLEMVTFPRSE